MLGFVREAEAFPDLDSFRVGILPGLRGLVPCDVIGYNEVDLERGTILVLDEPPGALPQQLVGRLVDLADEHPVLARNRAGDLGAHAISDFLTTREFHRLALYNDLYRHLEAEDQISFGLPGRVTIGIAMNRSRRSFRERDRCVLDLLRPHLTQAWRHARARERASQLILGMEQGLEVSGGAIALLDADGRLEDASDFAHQLLEAYFGRGSGLPLGLTQWLASDRGAQPLVVEGSRGSLLIRRLDALDGRAGAVLVMTESRSALPSAGALAELGLSRRHAEVLRLVALGKDDGEIAAELTIATATVRKHLEHIYAALGVHTRTAAAARALGVNRATTS